MNSADAFRKVCRRIPGGCSTAAKSPLRNPASLPPYFAARAEGGRFTDDEGREWLDFDMALSAVVIGYADSAVDEAVIRQIRRGFAFSVPSLLEGELAERLSDRFPAVECVRFCKDGSDATSGAVRIARSATGRAKIVAATYHGWHDWSAVHHYGQHGFSPRRLGITPAVAPDTLWLSEESFSRFEAEVSPDESVAGIIVCPEHWAAADLRRLSDYCRSRQALLIFDEIKSGVRYGPRGVGGSVGVRPDLICLGKSIANGFPLAVLGGRSELMSLCLDVNFSTTAASEAASLAAALAVDEHLRRVAEWPPWRGVCEGIISRLDGLAHAAPSESRLVVTGYPGNFRVHTPGRSPREDPFRELLVTTLAERGVFSTGYVAPCAAHGERDYALLEEALVEAMRAWSRQPPPPQAGS